MILLQNQIIELVAISCFTMVLLSAYWVAFWWILDAFAGRHRMLWVTYGTLLLIFVSAIGLFAWKLEYLSDRFGLTPSMRQFIAEYQADPDAAANEYSLKRNELNRALWQDFMKELDDSTVVKDIDLLNCIGKRLDIRDISHIYAIQYVREGEQRFMLFERHDKSGGLFEPIQWGNRRHVEDEIAAYEAAGWKYVR